MWGLWDIAYNDKIMYCQYTSNIQAVGQYITDLRVFFHAVCQLD